jgi:polyhydroxybutyrate depolymerase
VIAKWTTVDVCPATASVTALPNTNSFDNSTVESSSYYPCTTNIEVKLLKVIGGGHQWPGTTALLGGLGTINRDIYASGEIWNFFRNYTCNSISTSIPVGENDLIALERISTDHFIVSTGDVTNVRYRMYDMNGRSVLSGAAVNGSIIDISAVSRGCFLLSVYSDETVRTYRLVR